MITGKINCSVIAKDKLFRGEKGLYLDIVLIESPNSKYGDDYMIVQGLSKEDRDNGMKGAILGNAKIRGGQQKPAPTPKPSTPESRGADLDEDVPF